MQEGIHCSGFYAPLQFMVQYYQGQPKGQYLYQTELKNKTNQRKTILRDHT